MSSIAKKLEKLAAIAKDSSPYVKYTDYATSEQAGLVKVPVDSGIELESDGSICVKAATEAEIDAGTETCRPIVPSNLDYAVKSRTTSEVSEDSTSPIQSQAVKAALDQLKVEMKEEFVPHTTVSDYPVVLTDALADESFRNLKVYGGCGKNLLPYPYSNSTKTINGITFTDNGDGIITANGTATADAQFNCTIGMWLEPGTYTVSGCPAGGSSSTYFTALGATVNADVGAGKAVTYQERVKRQVFIVVKTGTTVENITFKPQLEKGSTATAWEQYKEVGDGGKNLFDKDNAAYLIGYFNKANTAITTHANARTIYIPCEPNTTYTISRNTSYTNFHFGYTTVLPAVGVAVNGVNGDATGSVTSLTLTTGADAKYLVSYIYNGYSEEGTSNAWDTIIGGIQIEESTSATEYEPYRGKREIPLNISGRTVVSNWAFANTSQRVLTGNQIIKGYAASNYAIPGNVTISEVTDESISIISTSNAYGVGLDVEVSPNTKYHVSANSGGIGRMMVGLYDKDGKFLKTMNQVDDFTFTTPKNAKWAVLALTATANVEGSVGSLITFTDVLVEEQPTYKIPLRLRGQNLFDKSKSELYAIRNETAFGAWGQVAFNNDRTKKMLQPSTTYTASYEAEIVNVPGDEYALAPTYTWIGLTLYDNVSGKTVGFQSTITEKPAVGDVMKITKTFTTPANLHNAENNWRIIAYTSRYTNGSGRVYCTLKFKDIQITEGTTAPDYEPYSEQTQTATLTSPLSGGEYIDVPGKKRYAANGTATDITVTGELKTIESGSLTIDCTTVVSPPKIEVEYWQDKNKAINNLTSAILAQGGDA